MTALICIAASDVLLAIVFYLLGKNRGRKEMLFGLSAAAATAFTKEELEYFDNKISDSYNRLCTKGDSK